jgi:hypothetical protein
VKKVREHGGVALKQVTSNGIPDYLFLLPQGKHVFVEFKKDKSGRLSVAQQAQIHRLQHLEHPVELVYDEHTFNNFVKRWL